MATNKYIPAGMTSLVKRDQVALQVQTEYAYRPTPRITTTVSREGQVVHKIERGLNRVIQSLDEQTSVELTLRRQHSEIVSIIRKGPLELTGMPREVAAPETPPRPPVDTRPVTEQLAELPGVERVYTLDNEGNFSGDTTSEEFRRAFAPIFKNLHDLLGIFERLPGVGFTRRKGVYEVMRNRLYLTSAGLECCFVVVSGKTADINYEKAIRDIVDPPLL